MRNKNTLSLPIQSAILATLAALFMSVLMAITKKMINPNIPTLLVVFVKSLFGLVFSLPFLGRNPKKIFQSNQYGLHGFRILLVAATMLCTYYTYRQLSPSLATSLGMTGALFKTVLAILILKDKVDRIKWICLLGGYLGILCITQPHALMLEIGVVTALLANFLAGLNTIISKILSKQDSSFTIISYTNVGLPIIFGCLSYPHWTILALRDLLLLASVGALGLSAHYCYLTALKKASASFVAPFEYIRLPFAFLIEFILFSKLPQFYTVLGSLLIITATGIITYRDRRMQI